MTAYIVLAHSNSPRVKAYNATTLAAQSIPSGLVGIGRGASFAPDGQRVALAHDTSPFITELNTSDWSKRTSPATLPTGTGRSVAYSPDGKLLVVGHSTAPYLTIYRRSDMTILTAPATMPTGTVYHVAWSPDGTRLAVGNAGSTPMLIYSWNGATLEATSGPEVDTSETGWWVDWSRDGARLAIVLNGVYVAIYNAVDWSLVTTIAAADYGQVCAWSPDNTQLVIGIDASPWFQVFNTSDWSVRPNPASVPEGTVYSAIWSPDGSFLHVGFGVSPYFATYRTGDLWRLANPASLPAGTVRDLAYWTPAQRFELPQPYGDCAYIGFELPQPYGDAFIAMELPQPYGDCPFVGFELLQPYNISIGFELPQPYNISMGFELPQTYADCSFVGFELPQLYNISIGFELPQPYRLPIGFELPQPYGNLIGFELPQPYNLLHAVGFELPQPYVHTSPIGFELPQIWDLLLRNPIGFELPQLYSDADHPGVLTIIDSLLTCRGTPVAMNSAELALAEGDLFWTGTIELAELAGFAAIQLDDDVTLTLSGAAWNFLVDRKDLDRSGVSAPRLALSLISPTARLATPRTAPLNRTWETATLASDAAQEAAGTTMVWELVDWLIPPGQLAVHEADPLQTARLIAEAAGGLLESLPDGSLRARHRFPVRVPDWATAQPDHILTSQADIISIQERHTVSKRVDRLAIRQERLGSGYLSIQEDGREDGLNGGRSPQPGATVFLLVTTGPGVTVAGLEASIGTIFPAAPQTINEVVEVVFENTDRATLSQPVTTLLETTWRGRNLGQLTLGPDRQTITASSRGTAVASLRTTRTALAYGLALPQDMDTSEEVTVVPIVSGTQAESGGIFCQRGEGLHPGDDIVEPLLSGLPAMLSRGQAEIDNGEPLRSIRITTPFKGGILPGHLAEIRDELFNETWRGKVVSVQHAITPDRATTSLEFLRHAPPPA